MPNQPLDYFEIYYTEKLWELIPEAYRHEDGLANPPGVLRSLVEIMANEAARIRRSQDRLWEDQFIEWCQEWAVPYLGDLVGTRMVSALNLRGRRVDVAKTIYYRRRKGTPRVLEELISDIAGWEGKLVESFRRLARSRHGLDPQPAAYSGLYSQTLPGGWADLRRPLAAGMTATAFDEYHYTPDFRKHRGDQGRKNIPKLVFHLFRLTARPLIRISPFKWSDTHYSFDPSGRDIALFNVRQRQTSQNRTAGRNWEEWQSARIWELPMPIPCRVLGHTEYEVDDALIAKILVLIHPVPPSLASLTSELHTLQGVRFISQDRLLLTLKKLPCGAALTGLAQWQSIWTTILSDGMIPECGKQQLIPKALEVMEIPVAGNPEISLAPVSVAVGSLADWSIDLPAQKEKFCVVDPKRGRLKFIGEMDHAPHKPQAVWVSYHAAFPGPIGAGTYDRPSSLVHPVSTLSNGGPITQAMLTQSVKIQDSLTYTLAENPAPFTDLLIQAADAERPYLCLNTDLVFDTPVDANASLTLEGLWIGSRQKHALILKGDFKQVTIRYCTLDPGGINAAGNEIPAVRLLIQGHVDCLLIESSVLGPLATSLDPAGNMGTVENLIINDSILQSRDATLPALYMELGEADIHRTTILGSSAWHRLTASELLADGPVTVMDTQNGCFRFSAAGSGSRLPHPYESHILQDTSGLFTSRLFGHWGYAQIAESAPDRVRAGAENGSELGAFCACLNPIKLKSLQAKVEEYMPFGLIPIYIPEV